jgi:FkbM family methyltransferase
VWQLVAAIAAIALIGAFHREIIAGALYVAIRNPHCGLANTLAWTTFAKQEQSARNFHAASRLVRAEDGLELWQTPRGDFWFPSGDASELFADMAEQARGIYSRPGYSVQSGDVVADCGANVGLFTREALASGARKVIAIEPVPAVIACLRRNLAAEIESGKVVVVEKGVWHKDDFLMMNLASGHQTTHSFTINYVWADGKIKLPLTTLDKIVDELHVDRVDFIKMDIEGSERSALAGARRTLARFHPRMAISTYHLKDDPEVLDARIHEAWPGYTHDCGPCKILPGPSITPEVFFYR